MPLINITTSKIIQDKKKLLKGSSKLLSELTNKPEKFVMVILNDSSSMYFSEKETASCFVEIKSIGSLEPQIFAESISEYLSIELEIPIERIYINFQDVQSSMWAWNGKTFG